MPSLIRIEWLRANNVGLGDAGLDTGLDAYNAAMQARKLPVIT